jgi:hypothetical protein
MRRRTALAATLAAAVLGTVPSAAAAKGITSLAVCGAGACHPVDRAAVRGAMEGWSITSAPRRPEPFYTLRAKARVSSGEPAEVWSLQWLPRAGVTRAIGERDWTRPPAPLAAALRRAARGLRASPAARLGPLRDTPRAARIVEVYAPAERGEGAGAGGLARIGLAVAGGLLALSAAGALVRARRRGPRPRPARPEVARPG